MDREEFEAKTREVVAALGSDAEIPLEDRGWLAGTLKRTLRAEHELKLLRIWLANSRPDLLTYQDLCEAYDEKEK